MLWQRVPDGFVTDVGVDGLVDRDSDGFVRWLKTYVSRLGVESMVADDLNTYKPVVEPLGSGPPGVYRTCREAVMESTQRDRWTE